MGSRRRSVFERLGPPADAPAAATAAEEQAIDDGPPPGFGPPLKQRVALAHPLVARHLMRAHSQQRGAADGSQPASQEQAVEQPRKQQPRRRRQRQPPQEQQQGSAADAIDTRQQRQQPGRSRGGQGGVQQELQRLQAERDAAEEMLGQMVRGLFVAGGLSRAACLGLCQTVAHPLSQPLPTIACLLSSCHLANRPATFANPTRPTTPPHPTPPLLPQAAQTQSLLADKAALQQQAAKLEALACALQERLDYLLLEDDSQVEGGQGGVRRGAPPAAHHPSLA